MKVRMDIKRLVVHDRSLSRRQRINLSDDIGRELSALVQHRAGPDSRRRVSSPAQQIAAAVFAQLPPSSSQRPGRRR